MSLEANVDEQLHILFFPYLAAGHIIPLVDLARPFAKRGVRATVVTTHGNAFRIRHTIDEAARSGHSMQLLLLPFPSAEAGLPEGVENSSSLVPTLSSFIKFYKAINLLQQPLEQLIRDHPVDCIISDVIYSWTSDLALSLGIPRVVFDGISPFSLCIYDSIDVSGDAAANPFVVPGLPHRIELSKSELPITFDNPAVLEMYREGDRKSYGVVVNSFYELTPEYVDRYCRLRDGRKVWCVGPVWLCDRTDADKAVRGGDDRPNHESWERVRSWLDSKDPESVLYASFGSEYNIFNHDQLRELALGLEGSGHPFIWVVRGNNMEEWLPEGIEKRVEGTGLILGGWAPQVAVLNHPATGGFMTHCGWNSTIEAVSSGVPMITWPLQSDQMLSERLLVDVLGIGLRAAEGVRRTVKTEEKEVVKREAVSAAVARLMGGGEEASVIRRKVKEYKEMARSAMEEGGSSYVNMSRLIEELTVLADERKGKKG